MRYHITIKDTETNEIIADEKTNAIIGSFMETEDKVRAIGITSCNLSTIIKCIHGAVDSCLTLLGIFPTTVKFAVRKVMKKQINSK